MKRILFSFLFCTASLADDVPQWRDLFNGKDLAGWVDVNTSKETWTVKDGLLVCSGKPTGVMRSDKQYENFILHIEWMHMEAGGNSGVFVWSEGSTPPDRPLPKVRKRSKTRSRLFLLASICAGVSSWRMSSLPDGSPTFVVPPPITTIGLFPVC